MKEKYNPWNDLCNDAKLLIIDALINFRNGVQTEGATFNAIEVAASFKRASYDVVLKAAMIAMRTKEERIVNLIADNHKQAEQVQHLRMQLADTEALLAAVEERERKQAETIRVLREKKMKTVLDVCCGSKMFWFDRENPAVVFIDKRRESFELKDSSSAGGSRHLVIDPDIQADFTALPFPDGSFPLVIFDPPHLIHNGKSGWLAKKYGKLEGDWREELRKGFSECFRVLKEHGTLIFKWSEYEIPVSEILALTTEKPLIGHRSGKNAKTHWIVFMKMPDNKPDSADSASPHR